MHFYICTIFLTILFLTSTCKNKSPTSGDIKGLESLETFRCGTRPEKLQKLKDQGVGSLIELAPNAKNSASEQLLQTLTLLPDSVLSNLLAAGQNNKFRFKIFPGESFPAVDSKGKAMLDKSGQPAFAGGATFGGSEGQKLTLIQIPEAKVGSESLIHEIGHAVTDFVFSLDPEKGSAINAFKAISPGEKAKMHPYFGSTGEIANYSDTSYEWFAETFAMYYCSQPERDSLANKFPESYKFAVKFFAMLNSAPSAPPSSANSSNQSPLQTPQSQATTSCEMIPAYQILEGTMKGQTKAAHLQVRGPDQVCRDYDCPQGYFTSLNDGCIYTKPSATCASNETRDPLGNCITTALFHARYDNPDEDTDRDGIKNQYDLCLGTDAFTHTPPGQNVAGYIYPQGSQYSGCAPGQTPNYRQ